MGVPSSCLTRVARSLKKCLFIAKPTRISALNVILMLTIATTFISKQNYVTDEPELIKRLTGS